MSYRLSHVTPLTFYTKFGGNMGYFGVLSRLTPTLV